MQEYRDAGVKRFEFVPHFELVRTLQGLVAQDVGVMVRSHSDCHHTRSWTDYQARFYEEPLLDVWMACGGNLVFGDWVVYQRRRSPQLRPEESINMERRAQVVNPGKDQPAFAQLIRDRPYFGNWPNDCPIPDFVLNRMRLAMENRLLYPQ